MCFLFYHYECDNIFDLHSFMNHGICHKHLLSVCDVSSPKQNLNDKTVFISLRQMLFMYLAVCEVWVKVANPAPASFNEIFNRL